MLIGAGSVIKPGITVAKPLPPVAYFVDSAITIVNEGDTMTFNVSTIAVPDGTVLYWKVENETTTDSRFTAVSGSITLVKGTASFGITPIADHLTEGTTIFHVTLRKDSVNGTIVWTTGSKAVGDTSQSPTVTFGGSVDNVDEGDGAFIALTAHNIDNGTTIYWSTGISGTNLTFDRLNPSGGTTTISGGNAYININVSPDNLTSPDQQYFTVNCFINAPGGLPGAVGVGQWTVNINDTSQTPASGVFNGSTAYLKARNDNGTYSITPTIASFDATISSPPASSNVGSLFYGNPTTYTIEAGMTFTANSNNYTVTHINANKGNQDYTQIEFYPRAAVGAVAAGTPLTLTNTQPFTLGTTWTIEFWSKAAQASTGTVLPIMCQYPSSGSIDVYYFQGLLQFGAGTFAVSEPTPGVWTHVAITNNSGTFEIYYNGISQTTGNGSYNLTDTGKNLYIGTRGSTHYGQYFNGKLGSIRISNSVIYTTEFLPDAILQTTADTVFLWYPTRYTATLTTDISYNNYKVFNSGVTIDNDRPPQVHQLTVTQNNENGGADGVITSTSGADAIPIGATLMFNGVLRTVTHNENFNGSRLINVDPTPNAGSQGFQANAQYTFTWYT
jgi:Concanavalin A-like lectin/glucanases superfamily